MLALCYYLLPLWLALTARVILSWWGAIKKQYITQVNKWPVLLEMDLSEQEEWLCTHWHGQGDVKQGLWRLIPWFVRTTITLHLPTTSTSRVFSSYCIASFTWRCFMALAKDRGCSVLRSRTKLTPAPLHDMKQGLCLQKELLSELPQLRGFAFLARVSPPA